MTELVNVKGLSDLQKFLDQLPAKVEANIMRGALRAGGKVFAEAIKANLVTGSHVKTGELLKGLKLTTSRKSGTVYADVKMAGPHGHVARWLEFGIAAHFIRPKKAKSLFFAGLFSEAIQHPGFAPKPFMRPAFDRNAATATVAVGERIKARLTKEGINQADDVELSVS